MMICYKRLKREAKNVGDSIVNIWSGIMFLISNTLIYSQTVAGCYLAAYLGGGVVDSTNISAEHFNALAAKDHSAFSRYIDSGTNSDLLNAEHWLWADSLKSINASPIFFLMPFDGLTSYIIGNRDVDLHQFAQRCSQFEEPIFIIFGHEMNAPWSPWGQKPSEYGLAFKHLHDQLKATAPNISVCWIPGQAWGYPWGGVGPGQGYDEYYPGDNYVDWIGLTIHDRDWNENNISEAGLFTAALDYLNFYQNYAATKQKPMMLAETSLFDANWDPTPPGVRNSLTPDQLATEKNQWIDQVYDATNLSTNYPFMNMICYFHVGKMEEFSSQSQSFGTIFTDWRIPLSTGGNLYSQKIDNPYFLSNIITKAPSRNSIFDDIPQKIELFQNYPNPFNSATTISFWTEIGEIVNLSIFDQRGKLVRMLINEESNTGNRMVIWDGLNELNEAVASGIYYYSLHNKENYAITKQMILLR